MASRQQEDRAEAAAAKVAAKDLEELNRARHLNLGAEDQHQQDEQKRGVIGSVIRAVQDTYENAREAVVGKKDPADSHTKTEVVHRFNNDDNLVGAGQVRDISANKSPGIYDSATGKAKEAKDKTVEKGGEYKNYAAEKAKEGKDAAMNKMGEYGDYTAEKAKEGKDATMNKMGEYRDYTAEKAKEGKDATMNKMGEYRDYTAEKAKEGKDATMNKMGEYRDYTAEKAKEGKDSAVGKLGELKDSAADAAKRAMGYLGGKKEETREKAGEMKETTEAAKHKTKGGDEECGKGGRKVELKVEESRPGAAAETLKAADQIAGQAFNDVGRMDDEPHP
ncbi:hypothetical protein RJT34_22477 [Clitoria ternatea]|uniref:Late embryogenesis abundant protein ECP63-like domain-containing protein n=1 Tax=Clitoria ternatea TaxID=43366 RepID=A0AAN9IGC3_CLITE